MRSSCRPRSGIEIEAAVAKQGKQKFVELANGGLEVLTQSLLVRSKEAQASEVEDQKHIQRLIQTRSSFEVVDNTVRDALVDLYASLLREFLKRDEHKVAGMGLKMEGKERSGGNESYSITCGGSLACTWNMFTARISQE